MESRSHVRELFSQTLIYGFGIMLNKSVSFILLPLYTKYFPPEQIGLFTLIQSISIFLGVIYMFGVETSFMKFFIDARDEKLKSEIYSSSLILLTFTSAVLSVMIYFYSGGIASLFRFSEPAESIFLIKILCILMFVDTIYRFPLLLFRAELDSKTYAYINLLTFIINIICNVVLIVFLKKGVEAIFYSYIISVSVTFLAGLILTKKYLTFKISMTKIKELLSFGNKFIYIGIFILLIDLSDRFFLKYYFDESVVGIYSANYRLASVMGLFIAAFKFSWAPYFLNLSANTDNKKIISSIFTYYVFAGVLLFLIFSLLLNSLVKISFFGYSFLDENYWSGLKIVPIILLSYFFSGLYATLNAAPFFTDNTGSILIITFIGFSINIIFNFLLIPGFGITGAALSTLITYFVMFVTIYFYSQKIYRIDYEWKTIFKICSISLIFFLAGYKISGAMDLNVYATTLINLILIIIFLAVINYFKIIEVKKVSMLWKK
jgi:O-antigen/teichoic acid export membrane protein